MDDITQFANLSHVNPRFHFPFTRTGTFTSLETSPSRLQALLEAGVDLDAPNLFGQTPLFVASWQLGSGCPGQEVRFKMVCKFWIVPILNMRFIAPSSIRRAISRGG